MNCISGVVKTVSTMCSGRGVSTAVEPVTFGAGIPGYIVGPKGRPAVIVIQEWWGINDQIKAHAAMLSQQGNFRCLVPDLYKGKLGLDVEEANHHMSNLDFPNAVQEIVQAATFLKQEGSPKIGITGFCMGGALTMGGLAASPEIVCGAPFYGLNGGLFDVNMLKKPVQGHFGELDEMKGFSDAETGKKLQADLNAAGNKDAEVFIYPGVGHAFMNDMPAPFPDFQARMAKMGGGFPPYKQEQAMLAWSRLVAFMKKNLE